MATLQAAIRGGAETLVLCDTNGGILPMEFLAIFRRVQEEIQHRWGFIFIMIPEWRMPSPLWPFRKEPFRSRDL